MPSEGSGREEVEVWRCELCERQVGTSGGEPSEDCTCGQNEWHLLVGDGGRAEYDCNIERRPCDWCGSTEHSALEGPEGTSDLLCPDCRERYDRADDRITNLLARFASWLKSAMKPERDGLHRCERCEETILFSRVSVCYDCSQNYYPPREYWTVASDE